MIYFTAFPGSPQCSVPKEVLVWILVLPQLVKASAKGEGGDTRWEQGIWSVRGREESGNPRRSDEDKKQVNRVKEGQVAGKEGKRRTIGR